MTTETPSSDSEWELVDSNAAGASQPQHSGAPQSNPRWTFQIECSLSIRHAHAPRHRLTVAEDVTPPQALVREPPFLLQEQSSLFALPPEIRTQIYSALFRAQSTPDRTAAPRSNEWRALSFLATCRRVLFEAEPMFYALNRFPISSSAAGRRWLASLNDDRRRAIRNVSIVTSEPPLGELEQLKTLPNVISLHIRRQQSIRFTDTSVWRMCAKQMADELKQHQTLSELRIFMPDAGEMSAAELDRLQRMQQIDQLLLDAVSR